MISKVLTLRVSIAVLCWLEPTRSSARISGFCAGSGTMGCQSTVVEVDGEGLEALAKETGVLLWRKEGAGDIGALS